MPVNRALIKKILDGDTAAFRLIIQKNQRLVWHIVFRMVPNQIDREDLCQDIFIKVYESLGKFKYECKFSTWIGKVAYNTCLNHVKKKKVTLFDDVVSDSQTLDAHYCSADSPEEFTQEQDLSERLHEEIRKLPRQFATIVTLYHIEQMSYAEIGGIMRLPDGTVKSYLFRARQLLKERLMTRYQLEEIL